MEQKVNLYLAASGGLISGNIRRGWGYVLEVNTAAGITTREGFGEVVGTHRLATLIALSNALGRFCKPCEIHVHSEDGWVLAMLERSLDNWAENDYKDSKGKEIGHRAEWETVYKLKEGHLLVPEAGRHSYSSWLETEFKHRNLGEAVADGQQYRQMEMGECVAASGISAETPTGVTIDAGEITAPVTVQQSEKITRMLNNVRNLSGMTEHQEGEDNGDNT